MKPWRGEGCPDIEVVGAETLFLHRVESTDRPIHQQAHWARMQGRDGDKVGSPIKEQGGGSMNQPGWRWNR